MTPRTILYGSIRKQWSQLDPPILGWTTCLSRESTAHPSWQPNQFETQLEQILKESRLTMTVLFHLMNKLLKHDFHKISSFFLFVLLWSPTPHHCHVLCVIALPNIHFCRITVLLIWCAGIYHFGTILISTQDAIIISKTSLTTKMRKYNPLIIVFVWVVFAAIWRRLSNITTQLIYTHAHTRHRCYCLHVTTFIPPRTCPMRTRQKVWGNVE